MGKIKKQRSIRSFLAFIIILALVLFIAAFAYIFISNMMGMLTQAESQHLREQSENITGIMEMNADTTRSFTMSYCNWDDAYRFAMERYPSSFGEDNFGNDVNLDVGKLNFVFIKDSGGNDLYSRGYDFISKTPMEIPDGLSGFISEISDLAIREYIDNNIASAFEEGVGKTGYAVFDGVPYFICCMPVFPTSGEGKPAGTFVFASVFNGSVINDLARSEDAYMMIYEPGSGYEEEYIEMLSGNKISINKPVTDLFGNEGLWLKIEKTRTIYKDGIRVIIITTVTLIISTMIFGFLILLVVDAYISRPVTRLCSDIEKADFTSRLEQKNYGDNKEFSVLCMSINNMLERFYESAKAAEESKISISVLTSILNGMDAYIYVSDAETDRILFINDKMREHFNIQDSGVGRLCWELFQEGFTERCGFCPNHILLRKPEETVFWEEHNTVTGRYYKNSDKLIEWSDGRKVHMQHSMDITDLKKRFAQQELMASIAQNFISNDDIGLLITKALRMIGEFIAANCIRLAVYDEESGNYNTKNEWNDPSAEEKSDVIDIAGLIEISGAFREMSPDSSLYISQDVLERRDGCDPPELGNIKSFIILPVFVSDKFWGALQFDRTDDAYKWTESDVNLGRLAVNILSGVIERQIIEDRLHIMSAIVENSPQYILFADNDFNLIYFNSAACNISGYSKEELFKNKLYEILYDENARRKICSEVMPELKSKGECYFEAPLKKTDGEIRVMAYSAFAVGELGFGAIASDITNVLALQNQLVEAKELAEQGSRAKGEFLARMSHEMRTPMNAIIGMTNIAMNSPDIEKKEYCLDKISKASKHLLGVINDILDMSKIEADKFELDYTDTDIEVMLMNVTNVINFRVEEKKQEFIINIHPDVPQFIVSDEQRLAQVITNLLTNAVKFTPDKGKINLFINVVEKTGDLLTLEFHVKDTGIGISDEQKVRLFRSFEQADGSISRKFGGTGLGLIISKRIVNLMGGEIHVDSKYGEGSDFVFTIKAKSIDTQHEGKIYPEINREDLRILAVDDSAETLEYFKYIMGRYNFPCDTAENGNEAVEMIKNAEKPYNVIFTDWKMPEMNGIELTKKIREIINEPSVVIMISVAEWNEIEAEAVAAGVDEFIPKPLFPSVIFNCVMKCIGQDLRRNSVAEAGKLEIPDFSGYRILFAEDVEINREIVETVLENTGIKIDSAEDGLIAFNKFNENPDLYDLIFMDIHMPEVDGFEATRRIRGIGTAKAREIPIVAMTANVFKEDIEKCLAAGMNSHIGKPVDYGELIQKLNRYLKK